MKVKCALCDKIEELPDDSPLAKRLRNRPIHTYLCKACYDRITERTIERLETGKYRVPHRLRNTNEDW
ncbi:YlaI family protein [Caenibacillus caldisaponilyticus]|uniref:YlaI family protein n=1 Tax=Caenibacillus caldisaponilyticus TaxID=1674942 RepID=UPI00098885BD|nr:YlaI family protein [Caenibacillus caldisaponilyticus]